MISHRSIFPVMVASSLVLLSACSFPWSKPQTTDPSADQTPTVQSDCPAKPTAFGDVQGTGTGETVSTGSVVTLQYYLVDTCGDQMDSSTKEKPGEFSFTIGSGGVVHGFEQAVVGMQAGQTRDFTLAPEDAYGAVGSTTVLPPIPREFVEGTVVRTADKAIYQDQGRLRQEIDDQEILSSLSVGQQVPSSQDPSVIATVESISGSLVTFAYDNSKSPFYKKPLEVGTTGEKDGTKYEIISVTDTELTIKEEVPNRRTLASEDIKVGATFELKQGTLLASVLSQVGNKAGDKLEIVEIAGDMILVKAPNRNPNVGKSLVFHVEIKSVK